MTNIKTVLVVIAVSALTFLASCEGGSFKKKNCQDCETITSGLAGQVNKNQQKVCGDEVSAYITANSFTTNSLTVVTTCK